MVPGFAEIGAALSAIKVIADMARDGKSHEVAGQIVQIQSAMLELQSKLGEMVEENRELKQKLANAEHRQTVQDDLEMDLQARYYVRKSEKERGLIPYCPTCWGSASLLVPLTLKQHPGSFKCAIHNTIYATAEHLEHQRAVEAASSARSRQPVARGSFAWS